MKASTPLLLLVLVSVWALIALHFLRPADLGSRTLAKEETLRNYAAQLKANQLYARSAEAYDRFVESAGVSSSEKAKIDFNTGKMLLDQLGDAEGALAHFLRVTQLYDEVDPEIKKEARKLSAQCLEELGRSGAAERQLIASTRLGVEEASAEKEVEDSEILATIGQRVSITKTELEEAWAEIPPYLRAQQYPEPDGKENFLQELVATRLFAEAARRKGLDRDPEIQRRKRMVEESLLSQKLLEQEVASKVSAPESDLRLMYEAHTDHYSEPETIEVAHILVSDVTEVEAARATIEAGSTFGQVAALFSQDEKTKEQEGRLGRIQKNRVPLKKDGEFDPLDIHIPGLGKAREFASAAFSISKIGDVTGPIETPRGFHLIRLLDREQKRLIPFEQIRPQVEAELRALRGEEKRNELVAELIQTHQVRIHPERLED